MDWKQQIKSKNFVPSKKLGQNFLSSSEISQDIVELLEATPKSNVVEIGPGFGALTKYILSNPVNYLGVEVDKRLFAYLKEKYPNNNFINQDVLKLKLDSLFDNKPYYLISNLPYSISTLFLVNLLEAKNNVRSVLMIQKEVFIRMVSEHNQKKYNGFSVLMQTFFNIELLLEIDPSFFIPSPAVDSVVIGLEKKTTNELEKYLDQFKHFLKILFSQKRKTLYNNLKSAYSKELIEKNLSYFGIDKNVRAETLNVELIHKLFFGFVLNI